MVPNPAPPSMATTILPTFLSPHRPIAADRTLLAPEDAIYMPASQPSKDRLMAGAKDDDEGVHGALCGRQEGRASRSGSRRRRRRGAWKKLLWVKQSYPDNYTDRDTFLEHLQRNPRLQPYDFWPLVADSTVIVQHVCSVAIFLVCFVGIFQERVSPVAVVTCGSVAAFLGWVLWDRWVEQAADGAAFSDTSSTSNDNGPVKSSSSSASSSTITSTSTSITSTCSTSTCSTSSSSSSPAPPLLNGHVKPPSDARAGSRTSLSPRNQQRLATAKSAVLIYFALLGLSPILKSLTRSTSSDSIWAMSCWLMIIHIFFFDYGGGVGAKFPASLSTNAALMASTVLASRLPSTPHVFSLTLFSIEVFGLFPVFRRHLRHISWRAHLALTAVLILLAGAAVGVLVLRRRPPPAAALLGALLGMLLATFAVGGCSWWLISLQKYKNEIHGPWDPARPVIRRHWDGY